MQEFCKFPYHLSQRIRWLAYNQTTLLTETLVRVALVYSNIYNYPLFTFEQGVHLEWNIRWLADAIDNCITQYGADNVLFRSPFSYERVDSFEWFGQEILLEEIFT
jgi:hypothetical protein